MQFVSNRAACKDRFNKMSRRCRLSILQRLRLLHRRLRRLGFF